MSEIIKLSKLLTEILNEFGDLKNIKPVEWERNSNSYTFQVDNNKVECILQPWLYQELIDIIIPSVDNEVFQDTVIKKRALLLNSYNLSFTVDGRTDQARKTDVQTFFVILSTIVSIAKDFIETNNPFILTIFSSSKFGGISNDRQKDLIYREISKQHLPSNYYLRDIHIKEMINGNELIKNLKGLILFKRK
jgi:hypothetical protein